MFQFKEFAIYQDRTAMKVGTDGVLLGAWLALRGDERRVLDIGAGTGMIALMVAQRTQSYPTSPAIDAVEIDTAAYGQACENGAASPWSSRIAIHHTTIQEFAPTQRYDLIVSNPPFFVDSLLAPSAERSTARHTTQLSFGDLVASVVRLLTPNGRFAMVLPTTEQRLFDAQAEGKLQLVRRCNIKGGVRSEAKRQMSEYTLSQPSNNTLAPVLEHLTIRNHDGQYSDEYRALTREFYLKF